MTLRADLTAVVITKNEGPRIEACLKSLHFCKEILVLDSGSTDDTVARATPLATQVLNYDWPGDGPQRNRGIDLASSNWVLCIDADEQVSPALATELCNAIAQTEFDGFHIPFQSYYCGRAIKFGDWRNETHLRLFRKNKGHYSSSNVYGAQGAHCRPVVEGKIGKLRHKILHYSYPNLEAVLTKLNHYSTGGAALRAAKGKNSSIFMACVHGFWSFLRGYVFRFGFLDGKEGFLLALSNGLGTFYRYAKLVYIKNKPHPCVDVPSDPSSQQPAPSTTL